MFFSFNYLLLSQKSVPLQCVFHSIRFKVNKRLAVWVTNPQIFSRQLNLVDDIATVRVCCGVYGL